LIELGIAAASAFAIGFCIVLLLWPGPASPWLLAVKTFLGIGVGQGITGCVAFIFLLVHGQPDRSLALYELFVVLALVALLVRRRTGSDSSPTSVASVYGSIGYYEWILAAALCLAMAAALSSFLVSMDRVPYGQWDAWAIYNLRARSIYRGGHDWRDAFSVFLYRTHPDYPPLLPLMVVRAWMYAGDETMVAPRLIAGLFTAATIGLVVSVIALLRGRSQAWIAGVVLLGNTFLIEHGSAQYADLPLMFFYAAAVALLVAHDEAINENGGTLVLAGLAAGLAAWSKNEGQLFVIVVLVAHFAVVFRSDGWRKYSRQLCLLGIGLMPMLLIVAYFKLALAPPSDLVAMSGKQSLLAKLGDPSRYWLIASEWAKRIVPREPFELGFVLAVTLYAACAGPGARRAKGVALAAWVLFMLFMGYAAVYVVTPYPLAWHLFTSIDRVLLQLWPMFVIAFFLILRTPEEMLGSSAWAARKSKRVGAG
jgi:hypothetical protein